LGAETLLLVETAAGEVTARLHRDAYAEPGSTVRLGVPPEACYLFGPNERNKGSTMRSLILAQVAQIHEVRELVQRLAALLILLAAPRELVRDLLALNAEPAGHMAAYNLPGAQHQRPLPSPHVRRLRQRVPADHDRPLHAA
jgi:hypothetical protein